MQTFGDIPRIMNSVTKNTRGGSSDIGTSRIVSVQSPPGNPQIRGNLFRFFERSM